MLRCLQWINLMQDAVISKALDKCFTAFSLTWISGDLSTGMKITGLQDSLLDAAWQTGAVGTACWLTNGFFVPSSGFSTAFKLMAEDFSVFCLCSSFSSSLLDSSSDSELCLLLFAPLMLLIFSGTALPGSCTTLEQHINYILVNVLRDLRPDTSSTEKFIAVSHCLGLNPGFNQRKNFYTLCVVQQYNRLLREVKLFLWISPFLEVFTTLLRKDTANLIMHSYLSMLCTDIYPFL